MVVWEGRKEGWSVVAVARARAGDCRPSNRSTISSSWLFLAPRTMPASEGRYLAALPAEHKDAAPESLYQVRFPPAAQLTAAETRNRREGRVRRSVQRKTHRYRPHRRTQNHQPRHRRRRCRRYTKGNFPPPAAHARRLKLGRPAPQRDQVLWQSHAGPARLDHHGVRGRWKYTNSGTCLFYGRLLSPNTKQKSRAQPLKELHICLVIREVLLALAFLHKNGVIHRDIKGTFAFFFPSSFTLHVADLIMQPPTSSSPPSLIAFYFATLASPHSFNPPPPNGPLLSAHLTGWPPRS